ncbi:FecR family protein [Chitinophaga cymbidii]|uniref:Iron dicitrate transporter FecR n=1 Tax=Chitinophaga cymbidii TaxID=1096750 RepID=A0A512RH47_9BACT|nr:FecR family protein [Chitinophaga cymbidii]GEP95027.1 iron dicitrate transporter FecR [Chitinophaga cymbidii]
MDRSSARDLLIRYRSGDCTESERQLVESWILHGAAGPPDLSDVELLDDLLDIRLRLESSMRKQDLKATVFRRWLPYAAMLIFVVSAAIWTYSRMNSGKQGLRRETADVLPGGNTATLTLPDGSIVKLSDTQGGIVMGDEVKYTDGTTVPGTNGQSPGHGAGAATQNASAVSQRLTLAIPKGSTYRVTLPDGTRVWLNTASTLTYPSRFSDSERIVELAGEAYFEVSEIRAPVQRASGNSGPSRKVPFIVRTRSQSVEVLGTQFNIAAYADETAAKTTLVEGSVRVGAAQNTASAVLKPGQQSVVSGKQISVAEVDVAAYTSWKEGYFTFNGTELREAMRQLSRWYDVDVIYEGNIPPTPFYGKISRSNSLAGVLDILKEGNVHFRIENNGTAYRVIVMP